MTDFVRVSTGKGRVHCRQPGYEVLDGHRLDETGCIQPLHLPDEKCKPSGADYEVSRSQELHRKMFRESIWAYSTKKVIETHGGVYVMLNLLNSGFEHSVRVSVDNHKLFVVANDGGFVEPQEADVCSPQGF